MLQSKVSSPVANSGVSASMSGNEIVSHGETFSSGSKYHDIEAVEGHEQSNNSLNAFSHRAQKGLKYRDEFDDVSRHIVHSTEAACSTKTNNSNTTFPSNERPYLRNFTSFTTVIPSQVSAVPQIHCIWQYGLLLFSESSLLCVCVCVFFFFFFLIKLEVTSVP